MKFEHKLVISKFGRSGRIKAVKDASGEYVLAVKSVK